ncbi:MAG: O-antigen ligase family protein [Acidobacteria bacterium]|nr:O-antigen ligase family protein [Acidobacteriota bacterium]
MLTKITNFTFLLLIFALPFVRGADITYWDRRILVTEIIFPAAVLALILQFAVKKKLPKFDKFYLPLLFYVVAVTLSTVFSQNPGSSWIKLIGELYLVGIAVLTYIWISETRDLKKLVLVWTSASFIVALISAVSLFLFYLDRTNSLLSITQARYGTLPVGNYPRIQSLFLNPNMFCHYLTISWAFLLAALKFGWIRRWMFIIAAPVFAIAAAFTISPGIGGILLVIGLWFYFDLAAAGKKKLGQISLAAGVIGASLFYISTAVVPTKPIKDKPIGIGNISVAPSVRFLAWQNSVKTITEYPIFGKGLETDIAHTAYTLPSGEKIYITDSHQMWLNVFGQAGIFGLFALFFISYFLLAGSRPWKFETNQDVIRTFLAVAFTSAFIYQGLFGSYENARHLWVLIGLLGWSATNAPEIEQT